MCWRKMQQRCKIGKANDVVDLNEEKSIDAKKEIKVVGEFLRSLSFFERMKELLPHRCPLKYRIKMFPTLICFDQVHLHQEQTMK